MSSKGLRSVSQVRISSDRCVIPNSPSSSKRRIVRMTFDAACRKGALLAGFALFA